MSGNNTYRAGFALAAVATLMLAGCESVTGSNRPLYGGVPFKVKAKAVDKKANLALFAVTIKDAMRSEAGAREAADHAGTTYCIANYGSSKITWTVDPADTEVPLTLQDGDATFQGTCTP